MRWSGGLGVLVVFLSALANLRKDCSSFLCDIWRQMTGRKLLEMTVEIALARPPGKSPLGTRTTLHSGSAVKPVPPMVRSGIDTASERAPSGKPLSTVRVSRKARAEKIPEMSSCFCSCQFLTFFHCSPHSVLTLGTNPVSQLSTCEDS